MGVFLHQYYTSLLSCSAAERGCDRLSARVVRLHHGGRRMHALCGCGATNEAESHVPFHLVGFVSWSQQFRGVATGSGVRAGSAVDMNVRLPPVRSAPCFFAHSFVKGSVTRAEHTTGHDAPAGTQTVILTKS